MYRNLSTPHLSGGQRVRSLDRAENVPTPSNLWPCVFGMTLYKHEFQSLYAKQLARRTRAIINSHPPQPIKSRRRRPSYGLICIRMSLSRSFDNFQNWPIWIQPFLPPCYQRPEADFEDETAYLWTHSSHHSVVLTLSWIYGNFSSHHGQPGGSSRSARIRPYSPRRRMFYE